MSIDTHTQARPGVRPVTHRTALVAAHDVRKQYRVGKRDVEILHGITLGVEPGEMVAVMGPSGSGKSTLLYCLAGLERPTTGEVDLLGRPLSGLSAKALAELRRSEVGFVFQQHNLVPTLSVYENVALPHRLRRDTPPRDEILATLELVGIAELAGKLPPTLSGGEQQRVALARVLAQQPRIVFADEPTGALDTRTGAQVLAALQDLAHGEGRCVLTVTHDPTVAAHCDRVLFLRDGRLVRELVGPTAEQVAGVLAGLSERVES